MNISGFAKLTLLDYPEHVAATIFTFGCNMRCPFCHNRALVVEEHNEEFVHYDEEDVLDFLKKRQNILEGVCITGGEPLLQPDIDLFITKVKALGYKVKLDTNGSFPEKLEYLIRLGLIDYVAMDIKNSLSKYPETIRKPNFDVELIKKSINILMTSGIPYEFRTTVLKTFHTSEDMEKIGMLISGAPRYFIQPFKDSGNLLSEEKLEGFSREELELFKAILQPYIKEVTIRG